MWEEQLCSVGATVTTLYRIGYNKGLQKENGQVLLICYDTFTFSSLDNAINATATFQTQDNTRYSFLVLKSKRNFYERGDNSV